jgi:hypothetical protein
MEKKKWKMGSGSIGESMVTDTATRHSDSKVSDRILSRIFFWVPYKSARVTIILKIFVARSEKNTPMNDESITTEF